MSHCKVFDPVQEIQVLKQRVAQLAQEVVQLRQAINSKITYAVGGWPPDSFPQPMNGFEVKFVEFDNKETK